MWLSLMMVSLIMHFCRQTIDTCCRLAVSTIECNEKKTRRFPQRTNVWMLDWRVSRVNGFVAESNKSSTISRNEDGFAWKQSCLVSANTQLSQLFEAELFKATTVSLEFDWRHLLCRSCLKSCCKVSVGHQTWWNSGSAEVVLVWQWSCVPGFPFF